MGRLASFQFSYDEMSYSPSNGYHSKAARTNEPQGIFTSRSHHPRPHPNCASRCTPLCACLRVNVVLRSRLSGPCHRGHHLRDLYQHSPSARHGTTNLEGSLSVDSHRKHILVYPHLCHRWLHRSQPLRQRPQAPLFFLRVNASLSPPSDSIRAAWKWAVLFFVKADAVIERAMDVRQLCCDV